MAIPLVKITLTDQKEMLINETQVVSISPLDEHTCRIRMSNGENYDIISPPYKDWENDFLVRKS